MGLFLLKIWIRKFARHFLATLGISETMFYTVMNKQSAIGICETNKRCTHELRHEISNNVVCVTRKSSDQPGHTRSLIRAFASCLNIL